MIHTLTIHGIKENVPVIKCIPLLFYRLCITGLIENQTDA